MKVSRILLISMLAFLPDANSAEEVPKCHVYLDQSGWTTDVRQAVKARYSSQNLCKGILSGYPCYSYFEDKESCNVSDKTLVDLFITDAKRDKHIVE